MDIDSSFNKHIYSLNLNIVWNTIYVINKLRYD